MAPFPHIVIEPALPAETFAQLARDYPEDWVVEKGGHESDFTCRYFTREALSEGRLPPLWADFVRYHTSDAFFREAVQLLMPALETWYPERLDFIRRARTVPRGMGAGDIELETQFVVNLPCAESVRSPHLDNPRELYALLFYMRRDDDSSSGGDLEVFERRDAEVRMHGRREADPGNLGLAKSIAYAPNKTLLFLNTPQSFHGVSPRRDMLRNRRYLNIIAEVSKRRGVLLRKEKPWF